MLRAVALLIGFLLAFSPAFAAEEVVLGLSQNRVAITADFDGSEILIFGAIKRDSPAPADDPLGVVVAIEGPSLPLTVWRKEKKFGIWVNVDALEIDAAPAFYAVATSAPFDEVLTQTEDLRFHISIPQAIRSVGAPAHIRDVEAFTEAVIRIRRANQLYQVLDSKVDVQQETLFRTSIALPSNLTEGTYKTRIFLTRKGSVVSNFETSIEVRKVGLERFLFNLSRERPLIYGLMSLAIAIFAGWGASAFFQMFRRG